MERLTKKLANGSYAVEGSAIAVGEDGLAYGEAVDRLAHYENVRETLASRIAELEARLEPLKASGCARSATAQQLTAQKLALSSTLSLMEPVERSAR